MTPEKMLELDDDELNELSIAVRTEQDRRARLRHIPAQIEALRSEYVRNGGSSTDLPGYAVPNPEGASDG